MVVRMNTEQAVLCMHMESVLTVATMVYHGVRTRYDSQS